MKQLISAFVAILLVNCNASPTLEHQFTMPQTQEPDASEIAASIARENNVFRVKVTCDLQTAIGNGKFMRVDKEITEENFPAADCKEGLVDVHVLDIKSDYMTLQAEEVIPKMNKAGYRPATLWELLALNADQSELYWKWHLLVAPHAACKGNRPYAVVLGRFGIKYDAELRLNLWSFEGSFFFKAGFLGVRK
ncbi:hypothetical protein KJ657_04575 [Patescibacteria group bacterium]|nr:hypothetical protein [Patescibacteria group bacterium]MBU1016329.1 hypothetical protein [Patescibacteria group bacterium]MBU1685032.1 hypothetical protein [Patescibacteria group bacterium]MBU1938840.1 hypothetical protein [Patescibacteria group bacterium]